MDNRGEDFEIALSLYVLIGFCVSSAVDQNAPFFEFLSVVAFWPLYVFAWLFMAVVLLGAGLFQVFYG